METLPIEASLPALRDALARHNTAILEAPPGAGKTTRVPLALVDEPWLAGRRILMLEPRRLAARSACARMADELNESPGQTVGYRVRFEQRVGATTRVEVLTEGILTRRLQDDPELIGVGMVIFDEFHERSLQADLGLALCREIQAALRPDLRLLLMSATLDGGALATALGDPPRIASQGRLHPVSIQYHPTPDRDWLSHLIRQVIRALGEHPGDLLAFLPGGAEIRRAAGALTEALSGDHRVLTLYGDLPLTAQQAAICPDPDGHRRIVLATPIAETSLTIQGVRIVVDSGLARLPRFQARLGMTQLETRRISQDAADQRTGRAGRLDSGLCLRLWRPEERLAATRTPEIRETDLAPLALELARWGVEAQQLDWLDPPPEGALQQARDLLTELHALDTQGRISPVGQAMATLPGHPRLAHMLWQARALGLESLGCELAAILEDRDPLRSDPTAGVDLLARLNLLEATPTVGVDGPSLKRLRRTRDQWQRTVSRLPPVQVQAPWTASREAAVGLLLALAYPDRIAQRRGNDPHGYRLANGRGARLPEHDPLAGRNWLVAAHLDAGDGESRIFLAAAVDPDHLEKALDYRIHTQERVSWEPRLQAVLARRERRLGSLVLEGQDLPQPDPAAVVTALLQGIRQMGLDCLPWTAKLHQWRARVQSLKCWCQEQPWPDLGEPALLSGLEQWLAPHLHGLSRREHLQGLDLGEALRGLLPWPLPRQLDELAPTQLEVPSGSRITLRYQEDGGLPVLSVRLQELFGLRESPRVANGRVPVLMEILSPAQRPIQLTRDLTSFWENTYPEVRKELKGRYPKHYWPDDPYQAIATRSVRPRQ